MRVGFEHYYPLTDEEAKNLWGEAIFVFDTSAVLGFYREPASLVDEVFTVIPKIQERIWVPHQVGFEYHENLPGVEAKIWDSQRDALKMAEGAIMGLEQLMSASQHPFLHSALLKQAENFKRSAARQLKRSEFSNDRLRERIALVTKVIAENFTQIGSAPPEETIASIKTEGKSRYERKIPPGFEDAKAKPEARIYGDLIIWKQMIEFANAEKKPIIFITNDQKQDWWEQKYGKNKPHPQLREEMMRETGQMFYAYTLKRFAEVGVKMFEVRELAEQAEKDARRAENAARERLRYLYNRDLAIADLARRFATFKSPEQEALRAAYENANKFRIPFAEAAQLRDILNQRAGYVDLYNSLARAGTVDVFNSVLGPRDTYQRAVERFRNDPAFFSGTEATSGLGDTTALPEPDDLESDESESVPEQKQEQDAPGGETPAE